ncbi:carboxymuconolactone decarboxylase family protein [uncultured Winogradskyella sp.]|uniref:carboxymuconolactone decarboxylase family protein n=1 Tax=uncultured Winogradskyella sp. TaxID=395353 RepID=UPI00261A6126|nr:carboxymuconolactone decarboxylase family protein [uncultured Winogradskyella sp.]
MERITYQDIPGGMFENLRTIETTIENTTLSKSLIELIRLRTAQLNGCAYCVDMHYKELKHLGEIELRLSSLCVWEETHYFSEEEEAVLRLTDTLTKLNHKPFKDEIFNKLLKHFIKQEICYITLAIAQSNTWNRLMKVFGFTPGNYTVNQYKTN